MNGGSNDKFVKKLSYFGIHLEMHEDIFQRGCDPLYLLRELNSKGSFDSLRVDISRLPGLQEIEPTKSYINYDLVLKTRCTYEEVKNVFGIVANDNSKIVISDISSRFVNGVDTELADKRLGEILVDAGIMDKVDVERIAASHKRIGEEIVEKTTVKKEQIEHVLCKKQKSRNIQASSTTRIKIDNLGKLTDLIADMIISISRITLIARETGMPELNRGIGELNLISKNLQDLALTMRNIPLDCIFRRFYRVVRDLANSNGKDIELHISGEEIKLDKTIIEQITEPLTSLLRNCVEHSIELPSERKKAGKPGKGNIHLRAYRGDGKVIIELMDDGLGFDLDNIYHSNKKDIEFFNGKIEVKTTYGNGSKFRIKIPLTLRIIDGMRLRIGSCNYILPLDAVVESFPMTSINLKSIRGTKDLVKLRDDVFPLVNLHSLFGDGELKPGNYNDCGIVVLVENTFKKFCIYVDEILGISRAVIKNFQQNYHSIPGINGVSLNDDGSLSLIMDIYGIGKMMGIYS